MSLFLRSVALIISVLGIFSYFYFKEASAFIWNLVAVLLSAVILIEGKP